MHLTLAIGLWFIFISQGSSTNADPSKDDPASSDMCSAIMCQFPLVGIALSQPFVKDIITELTDCPCETITYPTIPDIIFFPCSKPLLSSYCTLDPCFCTNLYLSVSPACNSTYTKQNCPLGSNQNLLKKYSCQTFTNFTLGPLPQFSSDCSIGKNDEDSDFIVQWKVTRITNGGLEYMSGEVMCNAGSVRPTPLGPTSMTAVTPISTTDASTRPTTITPTTRNYTSANTTAELGNQSEIIIGVVVGVGGAVLLTIAIVIVIVVLRRRRADSNNLHDKNTSQSTPAVPSETAYASYTSPTSAAYDNATNGTTSNYQPIVYDNEEVGESNDAYTEVKEISDHNGYDNSETERSEAYYSMCKETGKDYEIVSENPTANTESETTVIDNEFYA